MEKEVRQRALHEVTAMPRNHEEIVKRRNNDMEILETLSALC